MAASVDSADGDIGFQIAPMVDVVFVLMLFFMASAGAQVLTKELHTSLPSPKFGSGSITLAMVDIAADGTVLLNDERIATPQDTGLVEVRGRFQQILREFGDKDAVLLRPNSNVQHERVVQVLSAIQAAGVTKVTFL